MTPLLGIAAQPRSERMVIKSVIVQNIHYDRGK